MNLVSERIAWINSHVKPHEIGVEPKDESFIYDLLDRSFEHLPVDITPLFNFLPRDGAAFLGGRTVDRLFVSLFNEEDNRIADYNTKLQVLRLCQDLLQWSRKGRIRLRRAIQVVHLWCDEIVPEEGLTMDWVSSG